MANHALPWALSVCATTVLLSCGGRTPQGDAVAGVGGAAGSTPASSTLATSTQGAGGSSATGGSAGQAGASSENDAGWCFSKYSRCRFAFRGRGEPSDYCPPPFDPTPGMTATGSAVLARLAHFLEDAPSVVPSGEVPAVASAVWASAEATAILDRHVASNVAPPGLVRFLPFWLDVPPSVAGLSGPQGWPLKLSAPAANLESLLASATADPRRVGILTEQELMALRPGISARGVWLVERLFCVDFPPGPDPHGAPFSTLPDQTRRENHDRLTQERPLCGVCHGVSDPLGASFEHFDEMGVYRDVDNGKPIDSSGTVQGFVLATSQPIKFKGIDDLAPKLATTCDVARCFTATMFNHALNVDPGPGALGPYSEEELNYVADRFADTNFSIRELVKAIVASPTFLR